jgi:hypothetical protein
MHLLRRGSASLLLSNYQRRFWLPRQILGVERPGIGFGLPSAPFGSRGGKIAHGLALPAGLYLP